MSLHKKKLGVKIIGVGLLMVLALQVVANNQDTRPYEFKDSDMKLNDVYKQIIDRIKPSGQIKLRKAQRSWIIFRDLDCDWAFNAVPYDCLIERTDTRTKELKETYFSDINHHYISIADEYMN